MEKYESLISCRDENEMEEQVVVSFTTRLEEAERLRDKVDQGFNELMKIGGYREDELKYKMPADFEERFAENMIDKIHGPDLERWFNELTHKYLEYVRRCHLECVKEPLQFDVRELFTKIKLEGLNEPDVKEFADLLHEAVQELN